MPPLQGVCASDGRIWPQTASCEIRPRKSPCRLGRRAKTSAAGWAVLCAFLVPDPVLGAQQRLSPSGAVIRPKEFDPTSRTGP